MKRKEMTEYIKHAYTIVKIELQTILSGHFWRPESIK